jgi:hypothetical protein
MAQSSQRFEPPQNTGLYTVLSLRTQGWTDRQIANHFNETGYLTPRGCRWLPQSVFSVRKKYERRLERLDDEWYEI